MIKYLWLLTISGFLLSCKREKELILPDATLQVMDYSGGDLVQEPGRPIELELYMQSLARINNLQVLIDGAVQQNHDIENLLSFNYTYSYQIPEDAALGSNIRILFRMTDGKGRISEREVSVKVNPPYTVDEFTLDGSAYQRIRGKINRDFKFIKDKKWLIDSVVSVDEGAVLTIEAGTTVYFRAYSNATVSLLSINRTSRIMAEGSRTEPIVFTSSRADQGRATAGDWGCLLLHGQAPSNAGASVLYQGFRYGGSRGNDNSGVLRFVRIEYAGKGDGERDFHALQLFGVGAATQVEYIEVLKCYNNAFRLRGGRVSLRYIAGIDHGGYGLWADEGWQGNGQFWLFQTSIRTTSSPNYWNQARSIEFRNNESFFDKQPRTSFKISNVTLIGNGYQSGQNNGNRRGIRTGSQGLLHNAIITQFPGDGVRVEDIPVEQLGNSTIIDNMHSYNNLANWEQDAKSFFFESDEYNLSETAVAGISKDRFDAVAESPYNPTAMGGWFISAPYIGAVSSSADWTRGGSWFKDISGNYR